MATASVTYQVVPVAPPADTSGPTTNLLRPRPHRLYLGDAEFWLPGH